MDDYLHTDLLAMPIPKFKALHLSRFQKVGKPTKPRARLPELLG